VGIDIAGVLVHLRGRIIEEAREEGSRGKAAGERLGMEAMGRVFGSRRRYEAAQKLARAGGRPLSRNGRIEHRLPGPLSGWTMSRDLPAPPKETFRDWWRKREGRG
jgi:L-lactate dehydrogenase complex protein LldF